MKNRKYVLKQASGILRGNFGENQQPAIVFCLDFCPIPSSVNSIVTVGSLRLLVDP